MISEGNSTSAMTAKLEFESIKEGNVIEKDFKLTMSIESHNENPYHYQTFYLFLMHYLCINRMPVQPNHNHPYPAPFVIKANQAAIQPAYILKQGMIHYGYQVVTSTRIAKTGLTVQLHHRKPYSDLFVTDYEVLRFQLYDHDGSISPCSYLDVTAIHSGYPEDVRAPYSKLNLKPFIPHPIPYNQSPVMLQHNYTVTVGLKRQNFTLKGIYHPMMTIIGTTDGLFWGNHFPNPDEPNSIDRVPSLVPEPHFNLTIKIKQIFEALPPGQNVYADHWRDIKRNLVTPLYEMTSIIYQGQNNPNLFSESETMEINPDNAMTITQSTQTDYRAIQQVDTMRSIISSILTADPMILREIDDERALDEKYKVIKMFLPIDQYFRKDLVHSGNRPLKLLQVVG